MKIVLPTVEVDQFDPIQMMKAIEYRGRKAYKSEDKITGGSAERFIGRLVKSGHHSVLEHEKVSACFIFDRGVSHEIVRHRIASYTQESTRYCDYSPEKNGEGIRIILPFFFVEDSKAYAIWERVMRACDKGYADLRALSKSPQEARAVLPQSLKTEIEVTYNIREWMHFFRLRAARDAHPQMQQVAIPALLHFKNLLPVIFGDIPYNTDFLRKDYATVAERVIR